MGPYSGKDASNKGWFHWRLARRFPSFHPSFLASFLLRLLACLLPSLRLSVLGHFGLKAHQLILIGSHDNQDNCDDHE